MAAEDATQEEGKLLNSSAEWVSASLLDGMPVGYYFAASWDKRCRVVTPLIAKAYNNIVNGSKSLPPKKFGIVYIPFDKDEKSYLQFMASMPWLSMPCGHPGIETLAAQWDVRDLPALVLLDEDNTIISRDATKLMIADPLGTNFPWRPQPVWDILASAAKINVAGGGEGTLSKESHKYYGLFFGGAWADPVKQFVPKLRELYNAVNSREANSFEVIYVPSDQKEDQYTAFVDKYPWLALPFRTGLKPKLSLKYKVDRIPRLVIINGEGHVVCEDACTPLIHDVAGTNFPWPDKCVYTMLDEHRSRQFAGVPTAILLLDGVRDEKAKTQCVAAFTRVAEHFRAARESTNLLFLWGDETMPVTELARKYVGFLDVPAPNFLIVDGAHSARYAWGPDNGRKGRVFPKEDQMMLFVTKFLSEALDSVGLPPADAAAVKAELDAAKAGARAAGGDASAGASGGAGTDAAASTGAGAGAGAGGSGAGAGAGSVRAKSD